MKLSVIKRTISLILSAAALVAVTSSCSGGKDAANVNYDDVLGAIEGAVAGFDSSEYTAREESYIKNFIKIDPAGYAGCDIRVSTEGGSINEYGVIDVGEGGSAADVKKTVEAYFEFYLSIWDDRYLAEEYPKIRDAEVRTFADRYVVYTILDKDGRAAVFSAVGDLF